MTVRQYLHELPPDRQIALEKLRNLIINQIPDIDERIHYKMPAYFLDGEIVCSTASQKHYLAF